MSPSVLHRSLASSDGVEKDHDVYLSMVQLERALDGEAEA